MEESINNLPSEPKIPLKTKPSQLLKTLCILTFIWSGLGILYNLIYALFLDTFLTQLPLTTFPAEYQDVKENMIFYLSAGRWFFVSGLIVNISSVYGAALMLKMNKKGFHFYAIAQIVMLMLPMIFIKGRPFSSMELMISLLFVSMYAMQTKVFEKTPEEKIDY